MENHRITFILMLHYNHEQMGIEDVKRNVQTLGVLALYPKNCCTSLSATKPFQDDSLTRVQRRWIQLARIMTREDIAKVSLPNLIADLRLFVNPMPQAIVEDLNLCLDVMIVTMKRTNTEEGRTVFCAV
jgi:hypothetical protein